MNDSTRRVFSQRLVLFIVLLLVVGGCTPGAAERADKPADLADDLEQLRSSGELLFPPELWSALSPSALSEVLRNLALQATGQPVSWSRSGADSYQALTEETDEVTAAALLVEADVVPPVAATAVTAWLSEADRGVAGKEALERLWGASIVADKLGVPVDLTDAAVAGLLALHADPSPWVQMQVQDILVRARRVPPEAPPAAAWLTTLKTGADILLLARDLYGWVTLHPDAPGLIADRNYWQPLLDRATIDDNTYSYAVRAFALSGNKPLARAFADQFDGDRLVGAGVLEPPVFDGSLGSTFRMIRYLKQDPQSIDLSGPRWTKDLVAAVKPLMERDLGHRLAGAAITYLLGTTVPDAEERKAFIDEALREVGADAPVLPSVEVVMAWLSIAEYAIVLEVPLRSPSIRQADLDIFFQPEDDNRFAVARLMLALQDLGSDDENLLEQLAHHLSEALGGKPITELNSLLLFAGGLGLARAGRNLPFTKADLVTEIDGRRGECLGGFRSFVRVSRTHKSVCNVEASRYALQLKGELK